MRVTDKYVFFWNGIYSQWYPSPMTIDGIDYNSCEQYMMHQKAITFKDYDIANKILDEDNPGAQKAIGRQIQGFDKTKWDTNIEIKDDFYKHQREILNNLGFNSLYEYYDNLRIVNARDNKIEEIISKI